jgi:hypothetical protein
MKNCPSPADRAVHMSRQKGDKYITIEPIMDFDLESFISMIELIKPVQVNIGADSGNNGLPEPPKEKILALIKRLEQFTTIHNKTNLKRLL